MKALGGDAGGLFAWFLQGPSEAAAGRLHGGRDVVDYELGEGVAGAHVCRGGHGDLGVALEEGAVFGAVVDREDESSLKRADLLGQGFEGCGCVVVVAVEFARADVWRVEEKERFWGVVDGEQLFGGATLKNYSLHSAAECDEAAAEGAWHGAIEPAMALSEGRAF